MFEDQPAKDLRKGRAKRPDAVSLRDGVPDADGAQDGAQDTDGAEVAAQAEAHSQERDGERVPSSVYDSVKAKERARAIKAASVAAPAPAPVSMYDSETAPQTLQGSQASSEGPAQGPLAWKHYKVTELIRFRDEISAALPPTELKEVNLEEELLLQFHSLRALQTETLDDDELPLNQRAQVANTTTAALTKLIDLQTTVYTQERFKAIESLLIRHLLKLPEEVAQAFLLDYERILDSKK